MIIYQIYPRSFKDSKGSGVGDLRGIITKLPYLAKFHTIDFLWISPFFQSPMKDFGYDISDYKKVDPIFGTNDDLYELIEKASIYNIKIMIDLVLAHTSNEHTWFQESRASRENLKADWYIWSDPLPDGSPPNNWFSFFGGSAWNWEPRRQQYYLKFFLNEQPALNWYNPEVEKAMLGIIEFWLKKGVRGFRLDAIHHAFFDPKLRNNPIDKDALKKRYGETFLYQNPSYSVYPESGLPYIQKIRKTVNKYTGSFLLGEISDRNVARKYTGEKLLHASYFFDILHLKSLSKNVIINKVTSILKEFPDGNFFWALSNHDFERHASRLLQEKSSDSSLAGKKQDQGKLQSLSRNRTKLVQDELYQNFCKLVATFFMMLPGGYCIYQGEELGLPGADLDYKDLVDPYDKALWPYGQKRDTGRTPLPWDKKYKNAGFSKAAETWLPIDPSHYHLSAAQQEHDKNSLLNYYRSLLHFKKEIFPERYKIKFLELPNDLIGFTVHSNNQSKFMCLFNLSETGSSIETKNVVTIPSKNRPKPKDSIKKTFEVTCLFSNCCVFKAARIQLSGYGFALLEVNAK
jgi:alpha-glucosidase